LKHNQFNFFGPIKKYFSVFYLTESDYLSRNDRDDSHLTTISTIGWERIFNLDAVWEQQIIQSNFNNGLEKEINKLFHPPDLPLHLYF